MKYSTSRLKKGKHSVEENVIIKFHIFNPYFSWGAKNITFITLSNSIIERFLLIEKTLGFGKSLFALKKKRSLHNKNEDHNQDTWVYLCFAKAVDHQHANEVEQQTQGLEGDDSKSQILILLDKAGAVISTVGAALPAG